MDVMIIFYMNTAIVTSDLSIDVRGSKTPILSNRSSVNCSIYWISIYWLIDVQWLIGEGIPNEENIKASIEAVVTKARQEAVEGKEESDESQSSSSNSSSSDSDSSGSKCIVSSHNDKKLLL